MVSYDEHNILYYILCHTSWNHCCDTEFGMATTDINLFTVSFVKDVMKLDGWICISLFRNEINMFVWLM